MEEYGIHSHREFLGTYDEKISKRYGKGKAIPATGHGDP
jgi:hypothetical protein